MCTTDVFVVLISTGVSPSGTKLQIDVLPSLPGAHIIEVFWVSKKILSYFLQTFVDKKSTEWTQLLYRMMCNVLVIMRTIMLYFKSYFVVILVVTAIISKAFQFYSLKIC